MTHMAFFPLFIFVIIVTSFGREILVLSLVSDHGFEQFCSIIVFGDVSGVAGPSSLRLLVLYTNV